MNRENSQKHIAFYLVGLATGVSLLPEEADNASKAIAATAPNTPTIRNGLKPLELLELLSSLSVGLFGIMLLSKVKGYVSPADTKTVLN
ncbi:MAG: hypothetical protein H0W77_01580 [Acidobacteria bacterium]|nr:hypothetical protein [Acidobacteriota bacterium]